MCDSFAYSVKNAKAVMFNGNELILAVVFNGEFYQARVVHPPMPEWNEFGIGETEHEAISSLFYKLGKVKSNAA